MERDQALKFMHDLLRLMSQKKGLRPVHHRRLSAGHQDRRQDQPGVEPDAVGTAHLGAGALDHERSPGGRFRSDQGMQLRHLAVRHRPLPRTHWCSRAASAVVCRTINMTIPNLDELGLPPVLKDIGMTKRGLIIFVGGTGTGKTTSLAAMVDYRNTNSYGHIITIEDPIEYVHDHKNCIVTQREVGIDTDSWEAALKNTLRQAPDVILMGEIRDRETMDYAVAFAETGHLCLATLHANSANQAIDRIINFFPEERRPQLLMDLSLNLRAMVSQRLLPKKDGRGVSPRSKSCSTRRSSPT